MRCISCSACRNNVAGGGLASKAFADGYVNGTNTYYGYKADAGYSEERLRIEVHYYNTLQDALNADKNQENPLGRFIRVRYIANDPSGEGKTPDRWAFRPFWWFGVPEGVTNVQHITLQRNEAGKCDPNAVHKRGEKNNACATRKDFVIASDNVYANPQDWQSISRKYSEGKDELNKTLNDYVLNQYDNSGNTNNQWNNYKPDDDPATDGLSAIFTDWESAGTRYYDFSYVAEITDSAYKQRDIKPLRFAAGIRRPVGNWRYAAGLTQALPAISEHVSVAYPAVTPVANASAVSDDEKKAIIAAIKKANENNKNFNKFLKEGDDGITIGKDGTATVTFSDNTTVVLPGALLVEQKLKMSEQYKPTLPKKTPVVNLQKLTADEKTKVRQAIIDANGKDTPNDFLKNLKKGSDGQYALDVKDNGDVEAIYSDGSSYTLSASDVVFQGATIADWAPYTVPSPIEVDNVKSLSDQDVANIKKAFNDANKDLPVYQDAQKADADNYITVDKTSGNVTIKWKDGSTTTIQAWQFLKERAKTPEPQPSPNPESKKHFKVMPAAQPKTVPFDPFSLKADDLTTEGGATKAALDSLKGTLKSYVKDADTQQEVANLTVEYGVDANGAGTVTFKAPGYEDATYPMGVFFKQDVNKQSDTPTTEQKTTPETGGDEHSTFKYNVTKTKIAGQKATPQEAVVALKQFVKDNYNGVTDADLQTVADNVAVSKNWTPKAGTKNMGPYGGTRDDSGPISSIKLVTTDNGIEVIGHPWLDGDPADWDAATEIAVITIKPEDLYTTSSTKQDHTLEALKKQAKALLKKRTDEHLNADDFTRAGIENAAQLNDAAIEAMNDEGKLRELIKKLSEAKHLERKSNPIGEIEVDDPTQPTEEDFKAAVKAFLQANYDNAENISIDQIPYTIPNTLTPKKGTVLMELTSNTNPDGIASVKYTNSDYTNLEFFPSKGDKLFTVKVTYKKKAAAPAVSADELKNMKDAAKATIDRNPNLTKEQKTQLKSEIDNAQTPDAIKDILKKAENQANTNKTSTDPKVKGEITNNTSGENAKKGANDKKEQEDKDKQNEQQAQQLQKDKTNATNEIDKLDNLTPQEKDKLKKEITGDGTGAKPNGADTPAVVQQILEKAKAINDAKGALKSDATTGGLFFLDHGTGKGEDEALNKLLGGTSQKDATLTALDQALKTNNATADSITNALKAAQRANGINEATAKAKANAILDAKKAALDAAYNNLTDAQKPAAKDAYEKATKAITDAKSGVDNATKPSEIQTALAGVKDETIKAAQKAIADAKGKRDTSQNTNDSNDALNEEKKAQIDRINKSDLPDDKKTEAINSINKDSHRLGDPTGIANRALKAQKIADALKKIDEFPHLNNAQKKAFKDIISSTDAENHKDANGNDTGVDDIDDALANATNTDNAMARLEALKEQADKFANGNEYKNAKQADKNAFDAAASAAAEVLNKEKDDNSKGAAEVNTLYSDLLKAMQAIDSSVKGKGALRTDALSSEVTADKALKPDDTTDPKTPGSSVYTTASPDKKTAFDNALKDAEKALKDAEKALEDAKTADVFTADNAAAAQKKVDDALDKLIKARLALDGVDTKPLVDEVAVADATKDTPEYKYADKEKQAAYDKAIDDAQKLLDTLAGAGAGAQPGGQPGAQPGQGAGQLATKEQKQDAINKALKAIADAKAALDGKAPAGSEDFYALHAMYRLYNPYTHEHLFTTDAAEKDNLVSLGWNFEGITGKVYMHGEKGGVYRLYNPNTGEHHYTTKEDEVAACVKAGWRNEGVKFFSVLDEDKQTVGMVSMYNPYEKKFYHHYTSDADEIAKMVKDGWRKEEIKWYAAK
ncbi:GA module [Fannyhessea vaginae PB189-T1-4]|uniref:GA module n=1 Tax=Fannyhessea vaginae PB189-T1-4 TaxID=866774 RepID=A0ABN0AZ50_9ACTN|nr:GA module-containing protein [Fannyhessea vaginae]EFL43779.1 GA module [Fannyhessea vaginae PB189-T1-4]